MRDFLVDLPSPLRFSLQNEPYYKMELEPLYINETTKHTWFPSESQPYFCGIKAEKNLTGETRNHFPFIQTFSILRQVLLARVYTQSCSFEISYVARPKKNRRRLHDGGVPWSFFNGCWWFVGCWTCVESKTQKLKSVNGNVFACITWRPMVGLKQHASWWF